MMGIFLRLYDLGISLSKGTKQIIYICAMHYYCVQLLDMILGHKNAGLFRRAQLKALVSIHGEEVSLEFFILYYYACNAKA